MSDMWYLTVISKCKHISPRTAVVSSLYSAFASLLVTGLPYIKNAQVSLVPTYSHTLCVMLLLFFCLYLLFVDC
jgi:hypothetical protein